MSQAKFRRAFPRFLLSAGLLICVLLAISVAAGADTRRTDGESQGTPTLLPKTVLPETAFDFGKVRQGEKVDHRFTIKNAGAGALKIERMHTSCGCTAAVIDSDTVAPGAETQVKVSFDTSGFQGAKLKTVRLYTNDPKQPSILFSLQGEIRPEVELSVARLHFGDLRRGQSSMLRFNVGSDKDTKILIQEVSTRSPYLEVSSEDFSDGQRQGKKVTVKLKPSLPIGMFRDRIVIKTSSGNSPVVNLPVFARVQGDLRLNPSNLSFGVLDGPLKAPVSREVRLENIAGAKLAAVSVESDNPSVMAEVISGNDGKTSGIKVTLKPDLVGAFRAKIKISTDHPDAEQRQIVLPVYGIVSRKSAS